MTIYNGFDINTAGSPKPWGARDEQAVKDIIDTLVGDSIAGAKATSGHVHNNLYYDASNTAVTIDGSGNATFIGAVGVNDLDVTTNIDTATMTATGTVGINDLDVTGNIDAATIITTGAVGIGVTPTESKLEVQDTTASNGIVKLIGQNAYEMFIQSVTNSAATVGNRFSFNVNSNTGEFLFKNSSYDGILINQYGQVGVRNTSPGSTFEVSSTAAPCTVESSCWSTTDTHEASLILQKSSSATINTLAETADDEALGVIKGLGVDSSSASRVAASISFAQDATAGVTRVPGRIMFNTTDATNEVVERMRLDSTGKVGIGISTPDGTCHIHTATAGSVSPDAAADDLIIENSGDCGLSILSPDANFSWIVFGSPTDNFGAIARWKQSTALMEIGSANASGQLSLLSGNAAEAVRIDASGNVGIGSTPSGTFKLEVNGFIKATSHITSRTALAGEDSAPSDENSFELGPGYLNLSRDDTVTIRQIQFGKNGSLHSGIQTSTNGFEIVGSDGNVDLTINTAGIPIIAGDILLISTSKTPASAAASGAAGSICWDADYIYVCTATDTWKRAAIATW